MAKSKKLPATPVTTAVAISFAEDAGAGFESAGREAFAIPFLSVLQAIEEGPMAAMAGFDSTQQRLANSADAAEGVQSFIEKRPARFQGR
jgi:hypothetical protein